MLEVIIIYKDKKQSFLIYAAVITLVFAIIFAFFISSYYQKKHDYYETNINELNQEMDSILHSYGLFSNYIYENYIEIDYILEPGSRVDIVVTEDDLSISDLENVTVATYDMIGESNTPYYHSGLNFEDYKECILIDEVGTVLEVCEYMPNNSIVEIVFMYGLQSVSFIVQIETSEYSYYGFSGGDGSAKYPFMIEDEEQLRDIEFNMDADYELIDDIIIVQDWIALGDNGANGYSDFTGGFNGAGHTITMSNVCNDTNECFTLVDNKAYAGLFAKLNGATIRNIKLDLDIEYLLGVANDRKYIIGGIAGYATNSSISNINVIGSLSYNGIQYRVVLGSIVGEIRNSIISNIENHANIHVKTSIYAYVGGIAGVLSSTTIRNSINYGSVESDLYVNSDSRSYIGGFIGRIESGTVPSTMQNCINLGLISTLNGYYNFHGALVGFLTSATVTIQDSYYLSGIADDITYWTYDGGNVLHIFNECIVEDYVLKRIAFYQDWDDTIWLFSTSEYPKINFDVLVNQD